MVHRIEISSKISDTRALVKKRKLESMGFKDRVNDINLVDLIEKNDLSMNIDLLPNDTIFIHDNYGGRITVVGEVKNPKTINYRKGMTILDVILDAGGFTDFASQNARIINRGWRACDGGWIQRL